MITKTSTMENTSEPRRGRSREGGNSGYKEVGRQAVYKEGDVKENMGPSVSMTVVGEKVEFTQNFNF